MDRNTVEANDRRLIKQFRDIVAHKEKKSPGNRPLRPGSVMLIAGLVAGSLFLAVDQWSTTRSKTDSAARESLQTHRRGPTGSPPEPFMENADREKAAAPDSEPPAQASAVSRESPSQPDGFDAPTAGQPAVSSLTVPELVTCGSVTQRQYDAPKTVFSLRKKETPTVWMTAKTDAPPRTLTHTYYLNGKKYCDVHLVVNHPRTRTWSHIDVNNEKQLGKWRVDVVTENGKRLKNITFDVVP